MEPIERSAFEARLKAASTFLKEFASLPQGPGRDEGIVRFSTEISMLQLNFNQVDIGASIPGGLITSLLNLTGASQKPDVQVHLLATASVLLRQPKIAAEAVNQGGVERLISLLDLTRTKSAGGVSAFLQVGARATECLAVLCERDTAVIQDMRPTKLGALIENLTRQVKEQAGSQHTDLRSMAIWSASALLNADMAGIEVDSSVLRACVSIISDTVDHDCYRYATRTAYDPLLLPLLRLLKSAIGTPETGQGRSYLAKAFYSNQGQLWSRVVDYASHLLPSSPARFSEAVTRDCALMLGPMIARSILNLMRTLEALYFSRADLPTFILSGLVEMSLLHWIPTYAKSPCCLAGRDAFRFAGELINAVAWEWHQASESSLTTRITSALSDLALASLTAPEPLISALSNSILNKIRLTAASNMSPSKMALSGIDGPPSELEIQLLCTLCSIEPNHETLWGLLNGRSELLVHLAPFLLRPAFAADASAARAFASLLQEALDRADDLGLVGRVRSFSASLHASGCELVDLDDLGYFVVSKISATGVRAFAEEYNRAKKLGQLPSNTVQQVRGVAHLLCGEPCPQRPALVRALQFSDNAAVSKALQSLRVYGLPPIRTGAFNHLHANGADADNGAADRTLSDLCLVLRPPQPAADQPAPAKKRVLANLQAKFLRVAEGVSNAILSPKNRTPKGTPTGPEGVRIGSSSRTSQASNPLARYNSVGSSQEGLNSPYAAGSSASPASPFGARGSAGGFRDPMISSPRVYHRPRASSRGSTPASPTPGGVYSPSPVSEPEGAGLPRIGLGRQMSAADLDDAADAGPVKGRKCTVCSGQPPFGYGFKICVLCKDGAAGPKKSGCVTFISGASKQVMVRCCSPACLQSHQLAEHGIKPGASPASSRPLSPIPGLPPPPSPHGLPRSMPVTPVRIGKGKQDEYDLRGEQLGILM